MWLEVLAVAFVAQLFVLPGEKGQFVVAGLSTRYDPKVVVSAAASAFAGWTALEVLFGEALQRLLPPLILDGLTAGLFALFAVLLYRSAPAPGESVAELAAGPELDDGGAVAASGGPDGGAVAASGKPDGGGAVAASGDVTVLGYEVPDRLGGFLPIFAMMAAGEFGDKTQLVTITLAGRYGAHPAIWAGEMLAIVPVSLLNAYFFHTFADVVDLRKAHLASAALFAFFAADTVLAMATGFSVWETVVRVASGTVRAVV